MRSASFEAVHTVSNSVAMGGCREPVAPRTGRELDLELLIVRRAPRRDRGDGDRADGVVADRDGVARPQRARAEPASRSVDREPSTARRRIRRGRRGRRARRARTSRGAAPRPRASGAPRRGRPRARRGGSCPTRRSPRTRGRAPAMARNPPIVTSMPAAPSGLPDAAGSRCGGRRGRGLPTARRRGMPRRAGRDPAASPAARARRTRIPRSPTRGSPAWRSRGVRPPRRRPAVADRRRTGRKRTRVPGASSAGDAASGSNSARGGRADQPPAAGGLARVGAGEPAASPTAPAGTRVRGVPSRGTSNGQSGLTR